MDVKDMKCVKILVIDDDPSNRIVISRLLRLSGIDIANIAECDSDPLPLLMNAESGFDVVFLDIQLPLKDGYSILREIRENPRISGLKIIALTANVMTQDVMRAREAGFDGFIGKPIDGRKFGELLSRILSGGAVWTTS